MATPNGRARALKAAAAHQRCGSLACRHPCLFASGLRALSQGKRQMGLHARNLAVDGGLVARKQAGHVHALGIHIPQQARHQGLRLDACRGTSDRSDIGSATQAKAPRGRAGSGLS